MPPRFAMGTQMSPYVKESASNNSSVVARSSNAVNRTFEAHRAYEVSRASGSAGIGGRAFISVSAGKGNSVSTYI